MYLTWESLGSPTSFSTLSFDNWLTGFTMGGTYIELINV